MRPGPEVLAGLEAAARAGQPVTDLVLARLALG
jgi:hypothetical protein